RAAELGRTAPVQPPGARQIAQSRGRRKPLALLSRLRAYNLWLQKLYKSDDARRVREGPHPFPPWVPAFAGTAGFMHLRYRNDEDTAFPGGAGRTQIPGEASRPIAAGERAGAATRSVPNTPQETTDEDLDDRRVRHAGRYRRAADR